MRLDQRMNNHPSPILIVSLAHWYLVAPIPVVGAPARSPWPTCTLISNACKQVATGGEGVVGNDVLSSSIMVPVIGQAMGYLMVGGRLATPSCSVQDVGPNPFFRGQILPME